MDSTSPYFLCAYCKKKFQVKCAFTQKYCSEEHRILHVRAKKDHEKQLRIDIKRELEQYKHNRSLMGKINHWYEVMGMEKATCGACGISCQENIEKNGVPLHMKVVDNSMKDYRLLDRGSWFMFCTDCYLKIKLDKELSKQDEK